MQTTMSFDIRGRAVLLAIIPHGLVLLSTVSKNYVVWYVFLFWCLQFWTHMFLIYGRVSSHEQSCYIVLFLISTVMNIYIVCYFGICRRAVFLTIIQQRLFFIYLMLQTLIAFGIWKRAVSIIIISNHLISMSTVSNIYVISYLLECCHVGNHTTSSYFNIYCYEYLGHLVSRGELSH